MDGIIDEVVKLAFAGLASVGIALLMKLLQRVGVRLEDDKRALIEDAARKAIAGAEEWAAAKVKAKVSKSIPGAAKLENAVARLLHKVPNISEDEARAIIQATLPQMGLGAAAGARELGKAIRTRK